MQATFTSRICYLEGSKHSWLNFKDGVKFGWEGDELPAVGGAGEVAALTDLFREAQLAAR